MGDIYTASTPAMKAMATVYTHLKHTGFVANHEPAFDLAMKKLKNFLGLSITEAAIFTYIFTNYYDTGEKPVCLGQIASDADCNVLRMLCFQEDFNSLEEKGFIKVENTEDLQARAKFYSIPKDITEALLKSDKALLAKGLKKIKDDALLYPEDISEKMLFYPEEIKKDVSNLQNYLMKEQFEAIRGRLAEKGMPKGVCIMLHGESGTGKTETVLQLAKATNRAIMHIDIGSTISCWHGGTEMNLSRLFERYNKICRQAEENGENLPILFFNEADALFGKRLNNPQQGSEIDENHIQSVLLDYLETQQGILIATTNLPDSFDKAFERRFLFKIKFVNPGLEIKKKIWKDKLRWLKAPAAEHLASSYSLSGAEIENVARKATMDEVLTGKRSSLKELETYCQNEKLSQSREKRIGFNH